MFYLVCNSQKERSRLMNHLLANGIQTATHYQSLHDSTYYKCKHKGPPLKNCKRYVNRLLRLPMFYELKHSQVRTIVAAVKAFYE
jgi:dTDP-4-amino-4,6-dideoxygalactose transaminase